MKDSGNIGDKAKWQGLYHIKVRIRNLHKKILETHRTRWTNDTQADVAQHNII